jgi:hypothetical protein
MYPFDLPLGKESQRLQLGAIGIVDVDRMSVPIGIFFVKVFKDRFVSIFLNLHMQLFYEAFPRRELCGEGRDTADVCKKTQTDM